MQLNESLCGLFMLVCLFGCASLPDVGPFVDATNKARKSVQSAAVAVEAELRYMGDDKNAKQLRLVEIWIKEFNFYIF